MVRSYLEAQGYTYGVHFKIQVCPNCVMVDCKSSLCKELAQVLQLKYAVEARGGKIKVYANARKRS